MDFDLPLILAALAYIVFVIGIGWVSSRDTRRQFVTARQSIGRFGVGASISVGWVDVAIFSTIGALGFEFGWSAMWLSIGVAAGLYSLSLVIPKIKERMDEAGHQTMIEYYADVMKSNRFGLIAGVIGVVYFIL